MLAKKQIVFLLSDQRCHFDFFCKNLQWFVKEHPKISPLLIFLTPFNSSPSLFLVMFESYIHCEPHFAIHLNYALLDYFYIKIFFFIIQLLDENNHYDHVYFLFYMLFVLYSMFHLEWNERWRRHSKTKNDNQILKKVPEIAWFGICSC